MGSVSGERFDPERLAGLPVEEAETPAADEDVPRIAPLWRYARVMRVRWRWLAAVSTALGVTSLVLAALETTPVPGLAWVLGALWLVLALGYLAAGCAEARRNHPIVITSHQSG